MAEMADSERTIWQLTQVVAELREERRTTRNALHHLADTWDAEAKTIPGSLRSFVDQDHAAELRGVLDARSGQDGSTR